MEKVQQWWNGRWGRLARVDVIVWQDGDAWVVEHRIGGVEGRSTEKTVDGERAADEEVARLLAISDDWRQL
jgi:hypothetical protein